MASDDLARALMGNQRLSPASENAFMRDLQFAPGWRDWRRGFERDFGEYPNTEPGGDYNYRLAWLTGAKPEVDPASGSYHGISETVVPPFASPIDLKAADHPTKWKADFMNRFGKNPDLGGDFSAEENAFIQDSIRHQLMADLLAQMGR